MGLMTHFLKIEIHDSCNDKGDILNIKTCFCQDTIPSYNYLRNLAHLKVYTFHRSTANCRLYFLPTTGIFFYSYNSSKRPQLL